jgi:hypothetical protein
MVLLISSNVLFYIFYGMQLHKNISNNFSNISQETFIKKKQLRFTEGIEKKPTQRDINAGYRPSYCFKIS